MRGEPGFDSPLCQLDHLSLLSFIPSIDSITSLWQTQQNEAALVIACKGLSGCYTPAIIILLKRKLWVQYHISKLKVNLVPRRPIGLDGLKTVDFCSAYILLKCQPLRVGVSHWGCYPTRDFALPVPRCWYLKTLADPRRTPGDPTQTPVDPTRPPTRVSGM